MNNLNIRRNIGMALLISILPIFSLLLLLFINNKTQKLILLIILSIWYGLTFPFTNIELDSFKYAEFLIKIEYYSFELFLKEYIFGYLTAEDKLDVIQQTISYFVVLLGGNKNILYMFFSFLFISLQIKYLSVIQINDKAKKYLLHYVVIFFIFLLCIPVFYINGFRFYFACWFFLTCIIYYLLKEQKKYLFYLFLTPLIHYSFILLIPLIFIFLLVSNFKRDSTRQFVGRKMVLSAVSLSFFIGQYILELLPKFIAIFSGSLASKANKYLTPEYIDFISEKSSKSNLIVLIGEYGFLYSCTLLYLYISWKKYEYIVLNRNLYKLWVFTALIALFSFSLINVPSMGRFLVLFQVLSLTIYYMVMVHDCTYIKYRIPWYLIFVIIFALFKFIVVLRLGIEVTGVKFFLPVFVFPFFENTSIYHFLSNL